MLSANGTDAMEIITTISESHRNKQYHSLDSICGSRARGRTTTSDKKQVVDHAKTGSLPSGHEE